MSLKTIIIGALGAGIIITALAVLLGLMTGGASASDLILKTVNLRENIDDSVARAKDISMIDDMVNSIGNEAIAEGWQSMLGCLQTRCVADDYFNFILLVIQEEGDEACHSDLLTNVIVTHRYWGTNESIVEFSKALTFTNDAVESLGVRDVSKQWEEIVKCNGVCAQKDALFFNIVTLILQS
jgi:hypothetical protein